MSTTCSGGQDIHQPGNPVGARERYYVRCAESTVTALEAHAADAHLRVIAPSVRVGRVPISPRSGQIEAVQSGAFRCAHREWRAEKAASMKSRAKSKTHQPTNGHYVVSVPPGQQTAVRHGKSPPGMVTSFRMQVSSEHHSREESIHVGSTRFNGPITARGPALVNLRARNRSLVVGAPLVPIQLSVSRAFPDLMDR